MVNQEQNPPQQEQPFVAAKQVDFNIEDIILNTNNEVALLYLEHNNKVHFKCVSDFISKCCLRKPFTRSPNMYKEYLADFWYSAKALENSKVFFLTPTGGIYGEVGVNTFRNAIGAHYLPHSIEYVAPPSINIARLWFETIGYGEAVPAKETLKKSLLPPRWSLANGINIDHASIFWEDIIIKLNKKHREQVIPYTRFLSLLMMHKIKEGYRDGELTLYPTQVFSVNNWALKPNQPEEPPFTDHMLPICTTDTPVVFKAPKTFSKAKSVSQGTKLGAKYGHKKLSTSSKQSFVSNREPTSSGSSKAPTSSKTGHSKKRKESSLAMDSNPSQPLVSTHVDTRMHKEDHSGMSAFNLNELIYSASFIIHSESASRNDASATSTAEIDPGKSAPSIDPHVLADQTKSVSKGLETVLTQPKTGKEACSIPRHVEEEEASSAIKHEDLAKLVLKVQPSFKDLDSPEDDPVIVVDDSDEDEEDVHTTTEDTLYQKHKLELKKNKAEAEVALLKAQPSFPIMKQLRELLTLQWELPTEFLSLPAQVLDYASSKAGDQGVPSASHADTMPTKGEKNINQATISHLFQRRAKKNAERKNLNKPQPEMTPTPIPPIITTTTHMQSPFLSNPPESSSQPEGEKTKIDKGKKAMSLKDAEEESTESDYDDETIHLPGSMVESSKKKELKRFDFVTEDGEHVHLTKEQVSAQKKIEEEAKAKAGRREAKSRITNCDILTRKGPITLKVYREDDSSEIIPEFKASNLQLGKWREVVTACPKKGKQWTSIYKQIQERIDYLRTTEDELRIDLDRPLSEQDPLDRLNDLANKKRKHDDDIHDFFRANKRLKSSVQYKDHTDIEIFLKLHQGLTLDDHARTFSSLLLAEIDKRNLNPLKQMRVIEQLTQ
ncbi:hypothetical protein Tco_0753071 [Tanacetum coccineum]